MMHESKLKIVFSLIISSILVNGYLAMLAMEQSVASQGLVAGQKPWLYYVETRPEKREFFVIKPFRSSSQTLHMYGCPCSGHESQWLYETCITSMAQLKAHAEIAKKHNDDKLLLQMMACSRILGAYQDATCSHMSSDSAWLQQKLDSWETIIKTFPKIDVKIREQYHCKEIFDDSISRAIEYAQAGNESSCSLLKCIFSSKSEAENLELMRSAQFRFVLEICARKDDQLNAVLQKFLYRNGTTQEKEKAYGYFVNKAQQGDLEACCYCAHGKLLSSDYSGALTILANIVASEQGRRILSVFERLCDDGILKILRAGHKKNDKDAYAILGIIFNLRKEYKKALPLLNVCARTKEQCPYIYYILGCLFNNGDGKDEKFGNAVSYFVKSIDSGADRALFYDIELKLHEMEITGNIAAFCELLFLKACDPECGQEIRAIFNSCTEKSKEHGAQCFNYMQKKKFFERLEREARLGKPGALFVLSQIYYIKGLAAKERAPVEFDRAFLTLKRIHDAASFDVSEMLGKLALELSSYYSRIDGDEKALWYVQKAVDFKAKDAERNLLRLRMNNSVTTEKDISESRAALLKHIEDCTDWDLREIAKTFIFKCESKSGISFPKDPQRGYELVNKLLARVPDDVDGLYMLGRLLYEHGGTGNIPADENYAQECLIKALEKKHEPQPRDFIHIACTYYKKAEYAKAFEWIEKASKLPRAKLYEGIFYLTVPASCVLLDKKDRDEKALACFAESLYCLNLASQDHFIDYVQKHEDFIAYIKNKAAQGDNRFLLVLLRFARVYGLEMAGIDKETAIRFVNIVLQNNVPSADSFCSYLYCTGTWLEKSEEQAFALSKKVLEAQKLPSYIVHEVLDTLAELSKIDHNHFCIMASYELSRYFMNDPTYKKYVLAQFSRAEYQLKTCIDDKDKEIYEYARKTGIWDMMLDKARYDDEFAICMGSSYAERLKLQPDKRWLNEIETKGMRYIAKIADAQYVSDAYVLLADALAVAGAEKTRCAALLNKAFEIKPDNVIALARLSELFCGPEGGCKIIHSNPHMQAMLQAMIEFEQIRLARTQELKEQHCAKMKRNLLYVIDQVRVDHGQFIEEQINSGFNKFLIAFEKASALDRDLQDIFRIIKDQLQVKGFIQT